MARKQNRVQAVGYVRTSSAANIGEGKDSVVRQRKAIQAFANRAGYPIIARFDDPSVAGADTIDTRPSFLAALEMIAGNGVRTGHRRGREPVCPRPHCPGNRLEAPERGWHYLDRRRRPGAVRR